MTSYKREKMMANTIRRIGETDEELAERFLHELDDNMLYCRAKRRHRYPVLMPPRNGKPVKVPKGFSFEPIESMPGYLMVSETCEVCGRVSHSVTDRNAFLTGQVRRRYEDPAGYTAPRGTGKHLQGQVALRELEQRLNEGGLFGMPGA